MIGLEPITKRLTAARSTFELHRSSCLVEQEGSCTPRVATNVRSASGSKHPWAPRVLSVGLRLLCPIKITTSFEEFGLFLLIYIDFQPISLKWDSSIINIVLSRNLLCCYPIMRNVIPLKNIMDIIIVIPVGMFF